VLGSRTLLDTARAVWAFHDDVGDDAPGGIGSAIGVAGVDPVGRAGLARRIRARGVGAASEESMY
jgi:hypothetical protein